ncbi:MAG: hypothetical protein ACEPOZ_02860 [Marinifilaceae bacterium]
MIMLLLPMLVILAHDIIPHHHHQESNSCLSTAGEWHHHQLISENDGCFHSDSHDDFHLHHSHQSEDHNCCHFNQNRFQKDLTFQVILVIRQYLYQEMESQTLPKFSIWESPLWKAPDRSSIGLRAPPCA